MKRLISLLSLTLIGGLAAFAFGQWQVQPQTDPRTGPIYPVNPSYNFNSASNYNPYQFNWAAGRWDYAPIPYQNNSQVANPNSLPPPNRPNSNQLNPWGNGPPPSNAPVAPGVNPPNAPPAAPIPDDSQFWKMPATTQPAASGAQKPVTFEGRIMAIKADNLMGDSNPHLLIRLKSNAGAMGTVDAGQRLAFPDAMFDPSVKGYITVTGQLGVLDGHLVLFADQIVIGSQTISIQRMAGTPSK